MSMLSSMCERLRQTADEVERIEGKNAVRLGLDAIALAYAAGELRDAADTIDGLRTRCQDVQAENKKLRHENEVLRADAVHWELGNCPSCPNVADLQEALEENARLRQLVDAWMGCGTRYHTMQGGCPMFDTDAEDFCGVAQVARDLGIEEDE